MYTCVYIYIYIHIYAYTHIHTYYGYHTLGPREGGADAEQIDTWSNYACILFYHIIS